MAKSTDNNQEVSTIISDSNQSTMNEDEEAIHFRKVIGAFLYYRTSARNRVRRAFYSYGRLPEAHKRLVPKYESYLSQLLKCIDQNDSLIRQMLTGCEHLFNNYSMPSSCNDTNHKSTEQDSLPPPSGVTSMDMDKVKTTIKQFVRDWSTDGEQERLVCYAPIIEEVKKRFPIIPTTNEDGSINNFSSTQILVPGAGLGRLSWEFARLGYACQGNEVSLYMLIASHFVLNRCSHINAHTIHPWILNFCNNLSNEDQLRSAQFPDVNTASLPSNSRFSMSAGDFLQVYNEPNDWDCVTTCFFIDTAHNIVEYVERLWKILKSGGVWINFGFDSLIRQMLTGCEHLFNNYSMPSSCNDTNHKSTEQDSLPPPSGVTSMDMDKVKTTIKQFVRDWSTDGEQERLVCYAPIIEEVKKRFPIIPTTNEDGSINNFSSTQILVPGAGLGRLSWEFARLGYACQGNEVSLYMLIASHFVLNRCSHINAHTIHPWILNFCNNLSNEDQLRSAQFPDVNTASLPSNSRFSMSAGDFLQVYNEPNDWDCVTTCFFIDTAHNIVEYVERLWKILKSGGVWINFGPLLYHFEDIPNESSFELSYADLRTVILSYGFQIEVEKSPIRAGYIKNDRSMLHYEYDCVFFAAVKP
ncbi:unnamed protein product [Rotaria socialis]